MAQKSLEIKGLSQRMWCTNRLLWHTNSHFYRIRTPTFTPYEPFLLGVGVIFNLLNFFALPEMQQIPGKAQNSNFFADRYRKWETRLAPTLMGTVQEPPTRTTCLKSTGSTPPICTAVPPPICNVVPCWLLSLEEREMPQYTSHLYRSTPPICAAVPLPFVPALLLRKYRGLGVPESS